MRCHGKTRAGKTCSSTSVSSLTDVKGKLVALPLQRGGDYCALHAKPFETRPIDVDASRAVLLVFIDTETTRVDIAGDRTAPSYLGWGSSLCRVGPARLWGSLHTQCEQDCRARRFPPADSRLLGSSFSTVVRVDQTKQSCEKGRVKRRRCTASLKNARSGAQW